MIGRTISHYRITDRLGEGGMGVVYRAADTKLERDVAIKFLHSGPGITEEHRSRFINEARAAAALNHPNIATIHEIGEEAGDVFIVMELVAGRSLRERIDGRNLDTDDVLLIAGQVADGLSEAHRKGIVHRDIKSANIMVLPDGRAKILDFGLAKMGNDTMMTATGASMGTIAYMSPEQARGEGVDHRTDIWAFGVVLYEMLAGRLPFPGAYEQSMMYAIFNEQPKPLEEIDSSVQQKFAPILSRLLAKNPEDRYPSMDEVSNDLKRLREPGVAAVAAGIAETVSSTPGTPSIAVLPFADMSREGDQEYFCDGITEELIDVLAQVNAWRVVSRSSTFSYKGKDIDIRDVGSKLSASHVVEGSLRKSGSRVRVTTRLSGADDGYQLWADKYDGQVDDIFDIQDEIARNVLLKLKESLGAAVVNEDAPIAKRSTDDMEAYNLYLQARFHMNRRTETDLREAVRLCDEATEIDATFAPAYAGKADALVLLAVQAAMKPSDAIPKARAAALKAIALDDTSAEAYTSLGAIQAAFEWNFEEAEHSFKQALSCNPSHATAHQWFGLWCLMPQGRFEECLASFRAALQLDPLSLVVSAGLGWMLYLSRAYEAAETQLRETLASDENFVMAHDLLGQTLAQSGRLDEAIKQLEISVQISGRRSMSLAMLSCLYGYAERDGEALPVKTELEMRQATGYVSPYDLALVHCGLTNDEDAIGYLTRALEQKNPWVLLLAVDPVWDRLRSHPEFDAIVKTVGLGQSRAS